MNNKGVEKTARLCLMETIGKRDSGGWKCCYCGRELLPFGIAEQDASATVDHQTPSSRGGDDSIANLALACRACNSLKGALTAEEFRAALAVHHK